MTIEINKNAFSDDFYPSVFLYFNFVYSLFKTRAGTFAVEPRQHSIANWKNFGANGNLKNAIFNKWLFLKT